MQKIAVVASSTDPAGINIRNKVIELPGFEKLNEKFDGTDVFECNNIKNKNVRLYLVKSDLIFSESLDKKIDADVFIFASKHRSKENTPSFAVHSIGNWGKAESGGKEKVLCPSSPFLQKDLFLRLNKFGSDSSYEITLEATHHGPFMEKPSVFVEVGSTEKEWNDEGNGKLIAKTIMDALNSDETAYKAAIGIGGPHYCNNFNKIALRTDIAMSHVCPKHSLESLDLELIMQSIEKTTGKADFILLDWKGLGAHKQKVLGLIKSMGIEFKRTDHVLGAAEKNGKTMA